MEKTPTKKTLLTIQPAGGGEPRRILLLTFGDGSGWPVVIHGQVGVTIRWENGNVITYPWTSISWLTEEAVALAYELV